MLEQLTSDRLPISDKKATGKKYGGTHRKNALRGFKYKRCPKTSPTLSLVANDKTFEQRTIGGVELEMGGERLELS